MRYNSHYIVHDTSTWMSRVASIASENSRNPISNRGWKTAVLFIFFPLFFFFLFLRARLALLICSYENIPFFSVDGGRVGPDTRPRR